MTLSMIAAEVLKLARRRGLMWTALAFMVGSVLVILAVVAADRWDERDQRDEPRQAAPPWRNAA